MDGERGDGGGGGGGELEVEDEFACAGMLRGSLNSLHGTVERIFRVTFGIGTDDPSHVNNGQIWLKLRGPGDDVRAAKLFVKGLVNQEEQQEVSYPEVLHCIFCGARGLFMDCLTKNTSAHIVVGSTGFLLISGLEEPVVQAYSLITDLVERYEGTQSRRSEAGDRGPGESLDSRRAFKTLVEKWEDKHILDLLVLPGSVKEILLDLVRESGLGSSPVPALMDGNAGARSYEELEDRWDKPFAITYAFPEPSRTTDRWVEGLMESSGKDSAAKDSLVQFVSGDNRGRAEGAEEGLISSPQDVGEEHLELGAKMKEERGEDDKQEQQLSVGNKEFWLLMKFFTAMGYTEDVVKRVIARTGLTEASQILDVVQQEQDRNDREQAKKSQDAVASNQSERNRPCETEHREEEEEEEEMEVAGGDELMGGNGDVGEGATGGGRTLEERGGAEDKEDGHEEDFVLRVVKKAAASCGYMEQNVAKVYSMLPDGSSHQLLLELQRQGSKETEALREEPREMDDVVPEKERPKVGPREVELFVPVEKRKSDGKGRLEELNRTVSEFFKHHILTESQTPHQVPEVKGPPMSTYPSSNKQPGQTNYWTNPSTSKQNQENVFNPIPKSPSVFKQTIHHPPSTIFTRNDSSPPRARERRGFTTASSVVVTGEQRFLEGLQMPFDLQLTDKPGNPKVRTIIIDGSNVAMSHGLGHFFSCRGIALAVQHFWDRGHRHISALLPQWRQKSDPRIKEQHYLTELQKLGLVSFTPSREVQGKRISSYDDRLMLQLAQKTDGVIVTNDNLRDLSDESLVWRDIIKKRLLQYTFVGDHFMVPDDPLGRGGPHLDDFLRSEHRTPDPGNHSFAGVATSFPSSKPPRSQTELLNFRDRMLNGAGGGDSRGKGRGQGKGWGPGNRLGGSMPGSGEANRSPEETASLRAQLCQVFPDQDNMVALVLQCHPAETDMNVLSDLILEQ
ncbi:NEDD4-binding protein 1 [Anoplopoma fimbria]|uniref:NEDD4-binding protein 1 n=1 Tax=Anoplopoma fimbria TaxID=229290 RepID=UPI0023ECAD4F|nr:NEDD4-binding protein 1 [Anoplopoma fimbria]XP_054457173.1 NEDD4-binding protein 1 [Anoplopoma fimbria]